MTPTDARDDLVYGPCCICGATNYPLSCGGPTICPKCDCGNFDAATVEQQRKRIQQLTARAESAEAQVERLREALERIADPTSFWSKHEDIARAALNAKPVGDGG